MRLEKCLHGRFAVEQRSALAFQALQSPIVRRAGGLYLTPGGAATSVKYAGKRFPGQIGDLLLHYD